MKKYLLIALCLVMGLETWAQEERNARIVVGMNNLTYTVKKAKTLEKVLDVIKKALDDGETLVIETTD